MSLAVTRATQISAGSGGSTPLLLLLGSSRGSWAGGAEKSPCALEMEMRIRAGGDSLRGASRALGLALGNRASHRLRGLGGGGRKHKDGQKAPVPPEFRSLQLPRHLVGDWQGRDTCVPSSPFLPACLGITPPRRQRCQNVCFVKEDVPVVMLESILTSPMFIL